MKATDIGYFRTYLLNQKGTFLNKAKEIKNSCLEASRDVTDEAEIASSDVSMTISLYINERDRKAQHRIEKALGKIESGTYGQCESCGDEIGINRLKAQPYAENCIHCMEEMEDPRNLLN